MATSIQPTATLAFGTIYTVIIATTPKAIKPHIQLIGAYRNETHAKESVASYKKYLKIAIQRDNTIIQYDVAGDAEWDEAILSLPRHARGMNQQKLEVLKQAAVPCGLTGEEIHVVLKFSKTSHGALTSYSNVLVPNWFSDPRTAAGHAIQLAFERADKPDKQGFRPIKVKSWEGLEEFMVEKTVFNAGEKNPFVWISVMKTAIEDAAWGADVEDSKKSHDEKARILGERALG